MSTSISDLTDLETPTVEHAREVGLADDEYQRACDLLGRIPNKVELGIISAMWSEHCSYKSSRLHLGKFPTTGPQVIIGPGENAGVVDIGDGDAICFKVESHNHPSYIEPYQGAATGVGGILRDVFTMGARPIAAANLLRFGAADHPKTPYLLRGVVAGIGDYGNCFGVPTVWTDVDFDAAYNGNVLVNAFALGIVQKNRIFLGTASGVGNPVLYVGAKTGRDGIHGATMASDSFSEEAEEKRPTVQVGDPFKEKLLLEACLECFQTDTLVGIQDMGAAGLTSSAFEMASRAGSGLSMDLDKIPTREEGMSAYEKMLSESQERMLLVAKEGREAEVIAIFEKWDLDCVTVGSVTDDGFVRLSQGGKEVAALPARPLADEAPKYDRPYEEAKTAGDNVEVPKFDVGVDALLSDPGLAPRDWVFEQFDRDVGVGTLADGGHAAAAIVQVPKTNKAVAIAMPCRGRRVAKDPREGGRQVVAEGVLRVSATGAEPLAVSDCLNFGNPQKPGAMFTLVAAIEGMAEACEALQAPVVSGNVSLYNETIMPSGDVSSVLPTPTVATVGLLKDAGKRATYVANPGAVLIRIGRPSTTLAGSRLDLSGPTLPAWQLSEVAAVAKATREAVGRGDIHAAASVSGGGLLLATCDIARASGRGLTISSASVETLLGEETPAILAAVDEAKAEATIASLQEELGSSVVERVGQMSADESGGTVVIQCGDDTQRFSLEELERKRGGLIASIAARRGRGEAA